MNKKKTDEPRQTAIPPNGRSRVEGDEDISGEDLGDERDPGVLLRAAQMLGGERDPELRWDDESPSDLQRAWRNRSY